MDALLERLAQVYFLAAVVVLVLPPPWARALGGIGLCLLGLAAAGDAVGGAGGDARFTTANEILAATGALIVLSSLAAAWRRRGATGSPVESRVPAPATGHPGLDPLLLAGLALAAAGPHLLAVGAGALLALAAAARGAIQAGRARWVIPLALAGLLLSIALALALTILGPGGGGVGRLPDGPFSPAAERLLVPLFGGAGLLVAGLPPLRRAPWRLALVPLGALLVFRIVVPAFPGGLSEWQASADILLVAALGCAALCGRWREVGAAAGLAALWSGRTGGLVAGSVLVLWAWAADQLALARAGRGIGLRARWAGVPALVPASAALPALTAMLREQVTVSVLGVAAVAVGLGVAARRRFPSA